MWKSQLSSSNRLDVALFQKFFLDNQGYNISFYLLHSLLSNFTERLKIFHDFDIRKSTECTTNGPREGHSSITVKKDKVEIVTSCLDESFVSDRLTTKVKAVATTSWSIVLHGY